MRIRPRIHVSGIGRKHESDESIEWVGIMYDREMKMAAPVALEDISVDGLEEKDVFDPSNQNEQHRLCCCCRDYSVMHAVCCSDSVQRP